MTIHAREAPGGESVAIHPPTGVLVNMPGPGDNFRTTTTTARELSTRDRANSHTDGADLSHIAKKQQFML